MPRVATIASGFRIVFILGALTAMGSICIDTYLPPLPRITQDLHASASEAELTLTACRVALSGGQIIIIALSDRFGPGLRIVVCGVRRRSIGRASVAARFAQGFTARLVSLSAAQS